MAEGGEMSVEAGISGKRQRAAERRGVRNKYVFFTFVRHQKESKIKNNSPHISPLCFPSL